MLDAHGVNTRADGDSMSGCVDKRVVAASSPVMSPPLFRFALPIACSYAGVALKDSPLQARLSPSEVASARCIRGGHRCRSVCCCVHSSDISGFRRRACAFRVTPHSTFRPHFFLP